MLPARVDPKERFAGVTPAAGEPNANFATKAPIVELEAVGWNTPGVVGKLVESAWPAR